MIKTIASEPIEKEIKAAQKDNLLTGYTQIELAQSALKNKIITVEQFDIFMQAEEARKKVIAVDDFTTDELAVVKHKEITESICTFGKQSG